MQYTQDYDEKFPPRLINYTSLPTVPLNVTPTNPYGWADALQPYVKSTQLFQCPSETTTPGLGAAGSPFAGQPNPSSGGYTDYWYNTQLHIQSQARIGAVSQTILSGDGGGSESTAYYWFDGCRYNGNPATIPCDVATTNEAYIANLPGPPYAFGRHLDGANYLFADGHVKWYKGSVIDGGTTINGSTAVLHAGWSANAAQGKPTFSVN